MVGGGAQKGRLGTGTGRVAAGDPGAGGFCSTRTVIRAAPQTDLVLDVLFPLSSVTVSRISLALLLDST